MSCPRCLHTSAALARQGSCISSQAPGNKARNWANSPLYQEPFLCWFVSEFWLLLFQSEPWSSLCLGVHCIFPKTQLRKEQLVSFLSCIVEVRGLTLQKDVSCSFYQRLLLCNNRPSLPATTCFSITNAIFKRVGIGIFSLNEVQYRPVIFLCASLLTGKKASSNGNWCNRIVF